ncbi:MAG: hypothetical protein JRD04_03255, partial [Deltaproteobacteria bacterium]|nr:hypothetical protein [Deltaproteobacteria bacterium]
PTRNPVVARVVDVEWWRDPRGNLEEGDLVQAGSPSVYQSVPIVGTLVDNRYFITERSAQILSLSPVFRDDQSGLTYGCRARRGFGSDFLHDGIIL